MQSSTLDGRTAGAEQPQLKKNAIGFWSTLTVGIASPAPAYTAAATLAGAGMLVSTAGLKSPAILLLGFIPLLLVAASFAYLNRAIPDAGTAFTWSTKALGPTMGFLTGWGMVISNTLVVGALAEVAAHYGFALLGLDALTESKGAVLVAAGAMMALGTWISARGIEASAVVEKVLIGIQVAGLVLLAAAGRSPMPKATRTSATPPSRTRPVTWIPMRTFSTTADASTPRAEIQVPAAIITAAATRTAPFDSVRTSSPRRAKP